jgi:hypothetical protein
MSRANKAIYDAHGSFEIVCGVGVYRRVEWMI